MKGARGAPRSYAVTSPFIWDCPRGPSCGAARVWAFFLTLSVEALGPWRWVCMGGSSS